MKKQIYLALLIVIIIIPSCQPSEYLVSERGDTTKISLLNNRVVSGELLAVNDTVILVLADDNILAIKNSSLKQIDVDKYSNNSWMIGVALLQVLPALVITTLAASYEADVGAVLAVSIVPAVISGLMFALSSPETKFDDLKKNSEIYKLKKFSRYPGGLTERQLKELLKSYGQESCIYLK